MDGTFNALGNSDRATAVIGRAIRLCLINLFDVRLGGIDRSTLGHPGKFSFCVAEDEESSPWEPLATARGVPEGASTVIVMAAGAPRQIMNEWTTDPEEILETFAAETRANMRQYSIWPGHYAIIVPRQLREHLAAEGFSRADVGRRLYERARIQRREWTEVGQGPSGSGPRRQGISSIARPRTPAPGRGRRLRRGHPSVVRSPPPPDQTARSAAPG